MKAHETAIAGLLIALQIITLLVAYIIPTIKTALLFAASLYSGVLLRAGVKKSVILISYLAAAVLVVLLIQIPEIQAGFAVFFGWYGLLHESTKVISPIKRQAVRWLGFLVSALAFYVAVTYTIDIQFGYALWIMALLGAAAFIAMQFIYEFMVKEFVKVSRISYQDGKITFNRK